MEEGDMYNGGRGLCRMEEESMYNGGRGYVEWRKGFVEWRKEVCRMEEGGM